MKLTDSELDALVRNTSPMSPHDPDLIALVLRIVDQSITAAQIESDFSRLQMEAKRNYARENPEAIDPHRPLFPRQ